MQDIDMIDEDPVSDDGADDDVRELEEMALRASEATQEGADDDNRELTEDDLRARRRSKARQRSIRIWSERATA